ncbi:M50 family metallopeptidase [Gallaecimonas sp. GXIMD4217]|uniref:M50 family metallopeptidase n=1 Tax=Gallaecimonas sp. GXIMD4217 TaxID=3131927 RepID=UPI00311ABE2A
MTSPRLQLAAALLAAAILSFVPVLNLPFVWLATFFHELSHGLAALATGGQVVRIELSLNGSGVCYTRGGNAFLIALSGYLGASLFGVALWWLSGHPSRQSLLRWGLLLLVAASLVLWGRDMLTLAMLLVLLAGLWWLGKGGNRLRWLWLLMAAAVLLNALQSPLYLGQGQLGDAGTLSQLTGLPPMLFVFLWLIAGLLSIGWCFKRGKA